MLLKVFMGGVCSGIERTLGGSAGDAELSGAVGSLEGGNAVWRDRQAGGAGRVNLLKFSKVELKVLHLGWGSPWRRAGAGETFLCLCNV